MNVRELKQELQNNIANPYFSTYCYDFTDNLLELPDPKTAIEPLLDFMAENPALDYGMPGALVHFIEKFPEEFYVDFLLASIQKQATEHNTWMLQRIMNTWNSPRQDEYIAFWKKLIENPNVDNNLKPHLREAMEDFEK